MFEGITVLYKGGDGEGLEYEADSSNFLCSVMSMSGCIAPVTGRYAFREFKEESNAKRSGRPRLIHSFSSRNRVEIGSEKNEITMTCGCEHTHV